MIGIVSSTRMKIFSFYIVIVLLSCKVPVPRVQYRSLTILNDSLSVGTQYLELMEVMIKY